MTVEARRSETLYERERELAALASVLDDVVAGRGAVVVIEGPAGIGKTTIVEAARRIAAGLGIDVLAARGGELERDFPFGVARQLFEGRLASMPARDRAAALEGAAALAGPILGLETASPRGDGAEDASFAALHGLYWLCVNLAHRRPLLLAVDDVHWADPPSLRFLAYLARRVDELRLALAVASRPPATEQQAALIEAVTSAPAARQLQLAPLSVDAVGALARSVFGAEPEPEFAAACHAATAGNPFLAVTLLTALHEEDVPPAAAAAPTVAEIATRAVSRGVVRRLGRLPEQASALARAVAILGTDAQLRHAAELAGLSPEAAARAADDLSAQQILSVGRPLEFVHPLVRAAVREQIPLAERQLAHRRAARILADEQAEPERVAGHLLATEPAADPWVVARLREAARSAAARGAPDAAAAYLERALDEPPLTADRAAVLGELGRAEVQAARPEQGIAHLREAIAGEEDPRTRALLAHDLAVGLVPPGYYGEAVEMLERAADDVAPLDRELALGLEAELLTAALLVHETSPVRVARAARGSASGAGVTPGERKLLAALAVERDRCSSRPARERRSGRPGPRVVSGSPPAPLTEGVGRARARPRRATRGAC